VFIGAERFGGVWLRRFDFLPEWTSLADLPVHVWNPDRTIGLHRPNSALELNNTLVLVRRLLNWILHYETAVLATLGVGYRDRCLAGFRSNEIIPPEQVVDLWRAVAATAGALLPGLLRLSRSRAVEREGDL